LQAANLKHGLDKKNFYFMCFLPMKIKITALNY